MKGPDETDRAIIGYLQYDGRMPYTDIAQEIGVSEGAVRRRVKRMVESGKLQIVGIAEPHYLGWNAAGMVGVVVKAGKIETVAREIAKFPEVSYLFMCSGAFDLFVETYCKDMEHLVDFLDHKLGEVPGVERSQTFMILKMYKISYRWGQAEPPRAAHQARADHGDGSERKR